MIQRTLRDIYATFQAYRSEVDLFYLAFSGGKDSLVMLDLAQRALPHDSFEVIFGDMTMELSDTYRTVEAAKNFFPDLNWHTVRASVNALDSWKFMWSPARNIRWCCPIHKSGSCISINPTYELAESCGAKVLFIDMKATDWLYKECLTFYEKIYAEAKKRSEKESNTLKATQWEKSCRSPTNYPVAT